MRYGSRIALLLAAASLIAGCARPALVTGVGNADSQKITQAGAAIQAAAGATGPPMLSASATPDMSVLRRQLAQYLSRQEGTWGVYLIDLATGKGTGYNADKAFPAASTFKLPMAMYILDLAAQKKASLDEALTYTEADYEEGTGILQGSIGPDDEYTVRELIEFAITHSDNIATNMLLRRFGRANVFAYMNRLGGKVTLFDEETVGTTPREMATYMRLLQSKSGLGDSRLRQFLLKTLSQTEFADRAAAGVPEGVRVAHKIGTLPGVVNDVAMVFGPEHTFVIACYSMGVDEETAPDVIASVTQTVYQALNPVQAATMDKGPNLQ